MSNSSGANPRFRLRYKLNEWVVITRIWNDNEQGRRRYLGEKYQITHFSHDPLVPRYGFGPVDHSGVGAAAFFWSELEVERVSPPRVVTLVTVSEEIAELKQMMIDIRALLEQRRVTSPMPKLNESPPPAAAAAAPTK
jgi:hypothetical protein